MPTEILGFLLPLLAVGFVMLLMARLVTAALKLLLVIVLIAAGLQLAGFDVKTPICRSQPIFSRLCPPTVSNFPPRIAL